MKFSRHFRELFKVNMMPKSPEHVSYYTWFINSGDAYRDNPGALKPFVLDEGLDPIKFFEIEKTFLEPKKSTPEGDSRRVIAGEKAGVVALNGAGETLVIFQKNKHHIRSSNFVVVPVNRDLLDLPEGDLSKHSFRTDSVKHIIGATAFAYINRDLDARQLGQ